MKQGQDVVGTIFGVDTAFLEVVAVALFPLLEVAFLPGHNVLGVDRNEVISVRPCVLVHKAEGVQQHQSQKNLVNFFD